MIISTRCVHSKSLSSSLNPDAFLSSQNVLNIAESRKMSRVNEMRLINVISRLHFNALFVSSF